MIISKLALLDFSNYTFQYTISANICKYFVNVNQLENAYSFGMKVI